MLFNCYKFFMKIKNLFIALSAMALATGCSNDEMTEKNMGNTIDFSVVAGKMSRATATTTNSINQFDVWAFSDGKLYMDRTTVTGSNTEGWTYSNIKFWPETSVDFYAVSPCSVNANVSLTEKEITDYEVSDGQTDLLYALNTDENRSPNAVGVNFRHALSQIVFKAKNINPNSIIVKIKGITVDGVRNKGTLDWPTLKTTTQLATVNGNTDTENDESWGKWTLNNTQTGSYMVNINNEITLGNDAVDLTSGELGNALFLMPQKLEEWLNADGEVVGTARLLVYCQIVDKLSGLPLWPSTENDYANVAISLTNPNNDPNRTESPETHDCWMQGKKYTYTLIFGEGAGYKPEVGEGEDPEPVLVPIKFEVTVDEFQNGGSYDADGKTK